MGLKTGTKLGPYEILSPLGAGGMGEVYRARDSKLDRDVAIKVLPEFYSRDPERVARFQREAKVLASLNHPHIAAIYGFEESDGKRFLVMELVEGETLGERIRAGSMSVEDALSFAKQIAEALEAAHESGIIHRDLKPANVKVTPDGTVKVLDFGLAKALVGGSDASQTEIANSPTLTAQHSPTAAGVILGTAAYMSPEQARGKPLDKRTDIWSFGCVLFEMLTGRLVFAGETATDSIGAILHKEPAWAALASDTPPTIQLMLRRCLAKDHEKRLRDIGDARIELEQAIADPTSSSFGLATAAVPEEASSRRRHLTSSLLLVLLALTALTASVATWKLKPKRDAPVRKLLLSVKNLEPGKGAVLSPDGRSIAFIADDHLWVRNFDRLEPRKLPDTQGALQPAWSPNVTHLAFAIKDQLWTVPVEGGRPTAIAALPGPMLPVGGISWTDNGMLAVSTGNADLYEVSSRGGELRTVLEVDPTTEEDFHHAAALPENRGVLFTIHKKGGGPDKIELWTPSGRKTLLHLDGERLDNPVYAPTGHILYARATTTPGLWAMPFSLSKLEVTGAPFLVAPDAVAASAARDGTLIFVHGTRSILSRLVWVNRKGEVEESVGQPQRGLRTPRLSPDGTRVAVEASEPEVEYIWIHDIERGTKTRFTFTKAYETRPVWIHGRDAVAYSAGSGSTSPGWIKPADGSGEPVELGITEPRSCSRDGKYVFGVVDGGETGTDILYLPLDGDASPVMFLNGPASEGYPSISPDGKLLAYESDESRSDQVFLTQFPSGEGKWQVSVTTGSQPHWSGTGEELFYIDYRFGHFMSVSVTTDPAVQLGTPVKLFDTLAAGLSHEAGFDVAPDGQRFLMVQVTDPDAGKAAIAIYENWFEEFKDRP